MVFTRWEESAARRGDPGGGFDIDAQARAIESIRDALQATGVKNVRLLLSGSGVFASEARATIQSEARWLSALATVLVILILLAAYRAPGPVVLSASRRYRLVAGVAAVSWISVRSTASRSVSAPR